MQKRHDQSEYKAKSQANTEDTHCSEYDTLGECLEAGSSALNIAHMSGVHLPVLSTMLGAAMEAGAEIIHNHSSNVIERVVCGTGVAALKETVNTVVARPAAVAAGAASSTITSPLGGAAIGALIGTATYGATNKLTTPLAHKLTEACHAVFEDFRKSQNIPTQTTLSSSASSKGSTTEKTNDFNTAYLASLIKKTLIAQQNTPHQDRTSVSLHPAALSIYQSIQAKLQGIQSSQNSQNDKIGLMLGEIKLAYKAINEQRQLALQQRNDEISRAHFQGAIDGFNLVSQVGRTANNKGIEQLGMAGLSLAQGTLAIAQLTGTLGITAVEGLAMISPITAAATAAFSLGSLIFKFGHKKNKKQARAMQAMFQQQAEQIMQVHQAVVLMNQNMIQGFEAMASGMRVINNNLTEGFSMLQKMTHDYFSKMGELIAQQHEDLAKRVSNSFSILLENQETLLDSLTNGFNYIDFKLDDQNLKLSRMDVKLDTILSRLQQVDFRFDLKVKQAMLTYAERYNYSHDEHTLFKLLQSIRDNILLATGPLKSLPLEEHISGWYQLNALSSLFLQPEFHTFPVDFENCINLDWLQSSVECLFDLLPSLSQNPGDNDAFITLQKGIFNLLNKSSKPTAELIHTLASKEFLCSFFNYYRNKLDAIQCSAETILYPLRSQLSPLAMQTYAKKLLEHNADPAIRDALVKTVADNSRHMAEQYSENAQRDLAAKVLEYNSCLEELNQTTKMICSLLQLRSPNCLTIMSQIHRLKPLHEHRYRFQRVVQEKHDSSLPGNASYTYLDLDAENDFQSFFVRTEEINVLSEEAQDYAELTAGYLNMITHFANTILMTTDPMISPETLNSFHRANLIRVESPMKIKLQPEEIQQTIESIKNIKQAVANASGKSVVYVIGVTGDGKSTLVNELNGSRYKKRIVNGNPRPQLDPNYPPELCKVGTSISQSETLMPQLIDVAFGNEVLTYCDLPGFEGSRERAVTLCESYTPMLLNAAVGSVRGVLWVLSDLHFRTTRSKEVKEILSYLLQIADPDTIAQSLTIVITKGSKHLTKEHVINNLHETVNAMPDSAEKSLLTQMIKALEQSGSIIVSQLYDHQNPYREEIHRAILSKKALSPKAFDFSLYNKEQMDLKHQVDKALKHQALVLSEQESTLNELSKCTLLLTTANKEQTQYGAQKEQHQATLERLKIEIHELSIQSVQCQTQLTEIERSNELVSIHKVKHHIPGQTHEVEIDEPTGQHQQRQVPGAFEAYQRSEQRHSGYEKKIIKDISGPYHLNHGKARAAYNSKIASLCSAGYSISTPSSDGRDSHRNIIGTKQVDDTSRPIYTTVSVTDYRPKMEQVPLTKKVKVNQPISQGHPVEYIISYQSGYPVTLKINQSTGWVVKPGTEQKAAGYNATIIYEQGVGCTIDMDIMIAKKYTPEERARYAQLQEQKNQYDRALLTLKQRYQESEAQFSGSSQGLTVSGEQLQQLTALEQELQADLQKLNSYLETNKPYFESMQELSKLLTPGVTQLNRNRYRFHQPQPKPIVTQIESQVEINPYQ